jgi:integrase
MARRRNGEGSIKQAARGVWKIVFTLSTSVDATTGKVIQNRRKKTLRGTYADAKEWLADEQKRLGLYGDESKADTRRMTLRAWFAECSTNWKGKKAIRPRTLQKQHENVMLYVPASLLDTPLRLITPGMLRELFEGLKPRVSHGTASYTYRVLRARLNDAVRAGKIDANPISAVSLGSAHEYRASEATKTQLTLDDVARFETAAANDRFGALWILLLNTGLRPEEALALQWDDVDGDTVHVTKAMTRLRDGALSWDAPEKATRGGRGQAKKPRATWKTVVTETKTTESSRDVALTPQAVAALERHKEEQAAEKAVARELYADRGLVFATSFGAPLNLNTEVPRHYKQVLKSAKLPPMSLYALRHSFATIHVELGTNPKVLSTALGHANVTTTLNRYVRPNAAMQRDAAKLFAERTAAKTAVPA